MMPTRKPISRARRAAQARQYAVARVLVFVRSQGRCEGCGGGITVHTMHAHHRLARSHGRDDRPVNLGGLCPCCHVWAHANPTRAREVGWILRYGDDPEQVPWLPCTDRLERK